MSQIYFEDVSDTDEDVWFTKKLELGSVHSLIFTRFDGKDLPHGRHEPIGMLEDPDPVISARIREMDGGIELPDNRPGLPTGHWDAEIAFERAHRFWNIEAETVRRWIKEPEECPAYLVSLASDGRETVVRFVWEIDQAKGVWDWYEPRPYAKKKGRAWGIPVVDREPRSDHRLKGTSPRIRTKDGSKWEQVMRSRQQGIRYGKFRVVQP